jgi:hypothetical protein
MEIANLRPELEILARRISHLGDIRTCFPDQVHELRTGEHGTMRIADRRLLEELACM